MLYEIDFVKELDQDMLMRFIGNSPLFPTALLPSDYVRWEPVDEHSAKLVVHDGNNTGVVWCLSMTSEKS